MNPALRLVGVTLHQCLLVLRLRTFSCFTANRRFGPVVDPKLSKLMNVADREIQRPLNLDVRTACSKDGEMV